MTQQRVPEIPFVKTIGTHLIAASLGGFATVGMLCVFSTAFSQRTPSVLHAAELQPADTENLQPTVTRDEALDAQQASNAAKEYADLTASEANIMYQNALTERQDAVNTLAQAVLNGNNCVDDADTALQAGDASLDDAAFYSRVFNDNYALGNNAAQEASTAFDAEDYLTALQKWMDAAFYYDKAGEAADEGLGSLSSAYLSFKSCIYVLNNCENGDDDDGGDQDDPPMAFDEDC